MHNQTKYDSPPLLGFWALITPPFMELSPRVRFRLWKRQIPRRRYGPASPFVFLSVFGSCPFIHKPRSPPPLAMDGVITPPFMEFSSRVRFRLWILETSDSPTEIRFRQVPLPFFKCLDLALFVTIRDVRLHWPWTV